MHLLAVRKYQVIERCVFFLSYFLDRHAQLWEKSRTELEMYDLTSLYSRFTFTTDVIKIIEPD